MKRLVFLSILVCNSLTALIARKDVPESDCWNISSIYATPDDWHAEYLSLTTSKIAPFFPQISLNKGKLAESSDNLLETLMQSQKVMRKLDKLLQYSHRVRDVDVADPQSAAMASQCDEMARNFVQEASWIEPELFTLSDERFNEYINDPKLHEHKIYLQQLLSKKPHTRSAQEEEILAQAISVLETPHKTFAAFNGADVRFGTALDSNNNPHEVTHASAQKFGQSQDRVLRKNAFFANINAYKEHENTLTENYAGIVKSHRFVAQARHYNSCLEAALKPNDIDVSVYHQLIRAVHSRIDLQHRYVSLRKRVLGLDSLHLYDLGAPLHNYETKTYTFNEAQDLVIEAVKPLGAEYQNTLKNGLLNERWVDRYENQNKRSGAYSAGCYDTQPFILMNFSGTLRDVFTLVHESGHSMHTYNTVHNQPYSTANYSVFVAEVASICNEELLRHMLLSKTTNKQERIVLINQALDDITGALLRQTMLAEFELFTHTACEQNIPLTPKLLKDKYTELLQFHYGPDLTIDPECGISWARVPHFYGNFYVYQYATGISAAFSLADGIIKNEPNARERYLDFLKAGSSLYPLDLLAKAGCDMRTTAPIHKTLDQFEAYLNELEHLLQEVGK
ncbi:MAG: oligoendopeptidase F [Chlamydiales bacterium]|nr:oligoendopeptidase F [Chlamydiales bacterium]